MAVTGPTKVATWGGEAAGCHVPVHRLEHVAPKHLPMGNASLHPSLSWDPLQLSSRLHVKARARAPSDL